MRRCWSKSRPTRSFRSKSLGAPSEVDAMRIPTLTLLLASSMALGAAPVAPPAGPPAGWIGVSLNPPVEARGDDAAAGDDSPGVSIGWVIDGGPADLGGVREGDRIVSID